MTDQYQNSSLRLFKFVLSFCMFATGAVGLVTQYVLATVTTYILGNSIEQWSIVIACMLLMMGLAGLLQNRMSDRNLMQKFVSVEIAMALIAGFGPLLTYAAFGYLESNFIFVHYILVLSIGFLIGFEIPLVMRIIKQKKIDLKSNITIVFAMDYIGAFVGAMFWVFYLLKTFPLTEISFIVSGFNFLVAACTILYFFYAKVIKPSSKIVASLGVTLVLLVTGFTYNQDLTKLFAQRFFEHPIVFEKTTMYQHITITYSKALDDTRFYLNGHTQFSSLDEVRYHEALVAPLMTATQRECQAAHPCNVLVLGGGDGLALRELHKYPHIKKVTLVDLDPEMIKIASTNPYLTRLNDNAFAKANVVTDSLNVTLTGRRESLYFYEDSDEDEINGEWMGSIDVYNIDADMFLRNRANEKWDMVIIDFPDPSTIETSKLYSKEFFMSLRRYLRPNAMISIQSTSPYHVKEAYLAVGNTMRAAGFNILPYRLNIPSFGDWGFYLGWTTPAKPEHVKRALKTVKQFPVEQEFLTTELMSAMFAFGKGELESQEPCVNTLMTPCLLDRYRWIVE